jgi:hypothetical protein
MVEPIVLGISMEDSPEKKKASYPSLDLAFEMTREQLNSQLSRVDTLDSKASFVFTSATVLTAASISFRQAITSIHSNLYVDFVEIVFVLLYVGILFSSYQAYSIREYKMVPVPTQFERYLNKDEHSTKGTLYSSMKNAFQENEGVIARKLGWTTWAMRGLVAEGVVVAVTTLVQVLH